MARPRLIVALVVLLFFAFVLVGSYYVRRCVLEQALCVVFKTGDEGQIAALLNSWPSPVNAQVDDNLTLLQWAAWGGNNELAKLCVEKGARVNRIGPPQPGCPWRMTPIQIAIDRHDRDLVEILIAHGADVNLWKGTTFPPPLHMAAGDGDEEIAGLLIAAGADVNAEDESGKTPMVLADENGHGEVARLLRARGAKK